MKIDEYRSLKGLPPRPEGPTVADSARIAEREKPNKFKAVKIEYDGITFDSKKEARRWRLLKAMQDIGEISNLERQMKYELVPKQEGERACYYIADFRYKHNGSGKIFVEDTKSTHTRKLPLYILKRKLMLKVHGIKISEV